MKNFSYSRAFVGLIVSFSLVASLFLTVKHFYKASPAIAPQIAVGIVNISIIRNEALVFKSFKELANTQYKSFHSDILAQETVIRENYAQIKQLENTSKKQTAELQQRRSDLDKKVSELEKSARDKKELFNDWLRSVTNEIEQTIQEIIIQVAHKRQLNLVFNATILDAPVVLYGGKELDITPYVLEDLDKRLPEIKRP